MLSFSLNVSMLKVTCPRQSLFFLIPELRLFILVKNDESTYLLARTYYLSGDVNKSYWLLRNSSIEHVPAAKLLLARCCFDTDKYVSARACPRAARIAVFLQTS